ncbi:MAG: type IV toxin-antitoxin system AbiEi family antitoxin [Chitinophagales bacterium]|nr:hypothetical protein [Bacteroidota bacterium]MCB9043711.1 hypothetical protein [Chitinophagales bacterium]
MEDFYVIESREILTETAESLQKRLGCTCRLQFRKMQRKEKIRDFLDIEIEGIWHKFEVQIEKFVNKGTIGYILNKITETPVSPDRKVLLISPFVSSAVSDILTQGGISFADASGNAHLRTEQIFVLISGQKRNTPLEKRQPSRAFQDAGIRLLFALLHQPELLNMPYRDIAPIAGVALGSVTYVMNDLKAGGFLLEIQEKEKKLTQFPELLERWVSYYKEIFYPKIIKGRFRFSLPHYYEKWQSLNLKEVDTLWGGEAAAFLLAGGEIPQRFSIYTPLRWQDIAKKYALIPDKDGDVEIVAKFWDDEIIKGQSYPHKEVIVPPLLVYADLMGSAEAKNNALAQQIAKSSHFPIKIN